MNETETTQVAVAELVENSAMIEQQRILNEMLARSATDREFRQLMLADARAAFGAHGVELPEGLEVRFIENHYDATIVLPAALDDMRELTEDELAQLNGGSEPATSAAVSAAVVSNIWCFVASAVVSGGFALTAYIAAKKLQ
jgi:hypothetical protein